MNSILIWMITILYGVIGGVSTLALCLCVIKK